MDTCFGIGSAPGLLSSPVKRMLRSVKREPGAASGALVYTGPERTDPVKGHRRRSTDGQDQRSLRRKRQSLCGVLRVKRPRLSKHEVTACLW